MGNKRINWHPYVECLDELATEINRVSVATEDSLIAQLERIFGRNFSARAGVDARSIAFIEFCFFKAEGPYSPKFEYFTKVISKVLSQSPGIRCLLDLTADAAIANMALGARGNLKFEISDHYELKVVLEYWEKMGLIPRSTRSVFLAALRKSDVKRGLEEKNIYLLARLKQIFPFYESEFIPAGMDLSQAIFEHQKHRFDGIIEYYEKQKLSLDAIVQRENRRNMPVGMKRNNFLSYLLKKRHNYECQVCRLTKTQHSHQPVETHHIVPLEQGGADHSGNMIVLCKKHHEAVHRDVLVIEPLTTLRIRYRGDTWSISYN